MGVLRAQTDKKTNNRASRWAKKRLKHARFVLIYTIIRGTGEFKLNIRVVEIRHTSATHYLEPDSEATLRLLP